MDQAFVTTKEGLWIAWLNCNRKGNADRPAIPHSWWFSDYKMNNWCISCVRQVVIFQETARNHFWEAGTLMQSYMLETVQ